MAAPIYTQAEIEAKVRAINLKIESGVRQVSVDGTVTVVDLNALRQERAFLMQQMQTTRTKRPTSARINLGNF